MYHLESFEAENELRPPFFFWDGPESANKHGPDPVRLVGREGDLCIEHVVVGVHFGFHHFEEGVVLPFFAGFECNLYYDLPAEFR